MADGKSKGETGPIRELKVSGHTMALEPGLYCVFNTPGGAVTEAGTGLPGVRITAAPARASHVNVAAFHADGWIGAEEAALVRVTGQRSDVLVTVYQAQGSTAEAPKLQVVRLSGEPASDPAEASAPAPGVPGRAVDAPENVEVMAHIYGRGDVGTRLGEWLGESGGQRWIEGFGIAPIDAVPLGDIEYQAVLGRGWLSPWSEGGQFCGSRGMSLPILGLRVRLRGGSAGTHRVVLSATFVDGTAIGPVHDGDACEAPSLAALESFQVKLEPVGATAVPAPAKTKRSAAAKPARTPEPEPARSRPGRKTAPAPEPVPTRAKPGPKPGTKRVPKPAPAPEPVVPVASTPAPRRAKATTRRR